MNGVRVRQCAQQVISAHLLAQNPRLRDALIEEYAVEHEDGLLACVFDFVHSHAVAAVDEVEDAAPACFSLVLNQLGQLIEVVAEHLEESTEDITLALCQLTYGEDAPSQANSALRAAQTCLLIHMMVRRGAEPWGVQNHLALKDMCVVVNALGDLMWTHVEAARPHVGDKVLIAALLDGGIHTIMDGLARAHGVSTSRMIARYWGQLEMSDCGGQ